MRQLRIGESILGKDGKLLGSVERIVVNETAHRITHLVVKQRAIELGHFHDEGPEVLGTDLTADDLERMPDANEPPFAAPGEHWQPPAGFRVDSFLSIAGALLGQAPYEPPVHVDLRAAGIHEISEGSPVWASNERVGEVKKLQSDATGRVRGLVIHRGRMLGGEDVVVPVSKVKEVVGNNVHLELEPGDLERLEPYRSGE
jgi:sporulation protein YlmC with PRC-barrel domain